MKIHTQITAITLTLATLMVATTHAMQQLCQLPYNQHGSTALVEAASSGKTSDVRKLLAEGYNPNQRARISLHATGASALHEAALKGHRDTIEALLGNKNTHVDIEDKSGATPLTYAVQRDRIETAQLLLDAGANANAKTGYGGRPYRAPLHDVASAAMARLLLERGADINAREPIRNQTPLHIVASRTNADPELIRVLIASGADIHTTDTRGDTPISRVQDAHILRVMDDTNNNVALRELLATINRHPHLQNDPILTGAVTNLVTRLLGPQRAALIFEEGTSQELAPRPRYTSGAPLEKHPRGGW